MEHDKLKWWHQDCVIPGHPGDDYLLAECSDEDDYVAERIAQCDLMGYDVLQEMGYTGVWL
jgi:hypothetical protein